MGMTKKLYTINALATELERDRRTISSALSSIRPDGKSGKYDAWFLQTAINALDGSRRTGSGGFGLILRSRVDDFPERKSWNPEMGRCTAAEFATASGRGLDDVLVWLRAGMPYLTAGDWNTGDGFALCFPWASDWMVMASAVVRGQGDTTTAQTLRL